MTPTSIHMEQCNDEACVWGCPIRMADEGRKRTRCSHWRVLVVGCPDCDHIADSIATDYPHEEMPDGTP